MEWRNVAIKGYEHLYKISEKGDVYSLKVKRILKGSMNGTFYRYKMYHIGLRWRFAHRLVYEAFIGPIPQGKEINHRDMNKMNNHYTNLEAVTRQENVWHARNNKYWRSDRKGFTHSQETKDKMAQAKFKPINIYSDNKIVRSCKSIEEAALVLNTYRKRVYRALKTGKLTKFQDHRYIIRYANCLNEV